MEDKKPYNNNTGFGGQEAEEESSGFDKSAFAAAASFALLIISLSLIFYSFNLSAEISHKEEVIDQQQTQITALKSDLQQKEGLLSILSAPEVDLIRMNGLEVAPNAYGKIIWDSEKQQALLQVSNLSPLPENKSYQLWIIKNNKTISAGVFAVNDTSNAFFKIEIADISEQPISAFAVTLEPEGGSNQPTSEIYLYGKAEL